MHGWCGRLGQCYDWDLVVYHYRYVGMPCVTVMSCTWAVEQSAAFLRVGASAH